MSSSKKNKYNKNNNRIFMNTIYVVSIALFLLIFLGGWIQEKAPRNSYIKDIKVARATIMEKTSDNGKNLVRVTLDYSSGISSFYQEDLWKEVKPEFYNSYNNGSVVGVLAADVLTYKPKYFGIFGKKGQKFDKEYWEIQEIYPTYDEAVKANPEKQFTADAAIKKKKAADSGNKYFVMEYEGRTFSTQVETAVFEKYNVGQKLKCEFKSIGDLVKLTRITEQ